MSFSAPTRVQNPPGSPYDGRTLSILSFVYFTLVVYLSFGLPLAVLPLYVHLRMGYSVPLAGLVVSIQYVATLASRPWAGRISDSAGAKVSVLWGMAACAASGALLAVAALLHTIPLLSLATLILSRLALGVGESLGSTGATLWGISSAGPANTARVISFNGICTYGGISLAAPLGVVLDAKWGLGSIGLVILLLGLVSIGCAAIKRPVPVMPGEHLPFRAVAFRVAPHGVSLALGGMSSSVLSTFVALYYMSRHWDGAALCLTAFGVSFIGARLLFMQAINRFGGFPVAMACLSVESLGLLLLWAAASPWAAFAAAAVTGFGFSLVFPALGVEAVKRVTANNRGAALAVFTAFSDVSFFLVGPIAGAVISAFGYPSVFLFAMTSVLISLAIVVLLRQMQRAGNRKSQG